MFGQRLIDKKKATNASATKSPSQEMCDIAFCQLPSGEMKGLISWLIFNKKTVQLQKIIKTLCETIGSVLGFPVRKNENFDFKMKCLRLNEPERKKTVVVKYYNK